jgi:hypothetical protein
MMEKNEPINVPYIVHEGMLARQERTIKRLFITLGVVIVLLAITNLAWLIVFTQYDYESYSVSADNGYANYIGNDGDITYGECESTEENEEER